MTKDEALKLALDVLVEINKLSIGENAICLPAEIDTAMDAAKEALAQPESPPECQTEAEKKAFAFGWFKAMEAQRLAQPEQEPVAWANRVIGGRKWLSIHASKSASDKWLEFRIKEQAQGEEYEQVALYTLPPQRTWVGLTDEEKNAMTWGNDIYRILELAEAKLKEKNT